MRCGGVAIWSRLGIDFQLHDLSRFCSDGDLEVCGVRWNVGAACKVDILTCYRSPNGSYDVFEQGLNGVLEFLYDVRVPIVLSGDFNENSMTGRQSTLFSGLLSSYSLVPKVTVPTRICPSGGSIVDQVFTNMTVGGKSAVFDSPFSDHRMLLYSTNVRCMRGLEAHFELRRRFCNHSVDSFVGSVGGEDWHETYLAADVDGKFDAFHDILLSHFEREFPVRRCPIRVLAPGRDWVTDEVKLSSERLRGLFQLRRSDIVSREDYLVAKQLHTSLISETKKRYFNNKIINSTNVNKTVWRLSSQLCGASKTEKNHVLDICGESITDPSLVADEFNKFFIEAPLRVLASVPKMPDQDLCNARNFVNSNSIFVTYVSPHDIELIVGDKLKNSFSSGPDEFPSFLLRRIAGFIAGPLAHIVNFSLERGIFPARLKTSCVTVIHKKGDRKNVNNYRPISVASVFSKVFEYVVLSQMRSFFEHFCVLCDSQHGFRSGRSTVTAMLEFYSNVITSLDRGECPAGLFCDLSRAFDCVCHGKLLSKLERCGIRGPLLGWLSSYLTDRSQFVKVPHFSGNQRKVYRSGRRGINVGVPQGSVLGPILFIVFINDLPRYLNGIHTTIYADDTSLLISGGDCQVFRDRLDVSTDLLQRWFSDNSLYLNVDKTHYVVFHPRQRLNFSAYDVSMAGGPVERVDTVSFLGVLFDDTLTFRGHCERLIKSLNSRCHVIRNLRAVFDIPQLLMCYYGQIQSVLLYGLIVWGSSAALQDVFLVQKRIVRCIAGVGSTFSCRGLFKRFKLLPLPALYILELLLYVFKNKVTFVTRDTIHEHNTRNKHLIQLPQKHLALTFNTPGCLGIKLFNALPDNIKQLNNCVKFKRAVKNSLLSFCCYSVDEYMTQVHSFKL